MCSAIRRSGEGVQWTHGRGCQGACLGVCVGGGLGCRTHGKGRWGLPATTCRCRAVRAVPCRAQSLLVVEEYDKTDCESRGLLRQLLQHPELANTSWSRSVVLLESNLGMSQLQQMLAAVGRREQVGRGRRGMQVWNGQWHQGSTALISPAPICRGPKARAAMPSTAACAQVSPEGAEQRLRDLVFTSWQSVGCEVGATPAAPRPSAGALPCPSRLLPSQHTQPSPQTRASLARSRALDHPAPLPHLHTQTCSHTPPPFRC